MSGFKDYHQFLKKNSKKKNMCSVLKNTHGLGLKSVRKVNLLNGKAIQSFSKVINITPEMFEKLKVQVSFFYNLEKNKIFNNVKKKKNIKSYCGMRHILRLPVHGQRTHTNSKTSRKYIKKEI